MKRFSLFLTAVVFLLTPTLSPAQVRGDINNDNQIDLKEAVYALKVVSGLQSATSLTIQEAIDALPDAGGTVFIMAGVYDIPTAIHIHRSNVTLMGEQGTVLRLADKANQPVLLIGTANEAPTAPDQIENIRIANLEIDGNKSNQTSELATDRIWLRNNGIDVRRADDVRIENVDIHDARSGGVVTSWDSDRIFIANSAFHHNFFDGIALYDGQDIQVTNALCYQNGNAGLSLDNDLKTVSFVGGIIRNNGDVGIFARDAEDVNFKDLIIKENGSHGGFISHQEPNTGTGVKRLFFSGCAFISNTGYGLWLASTTADSPDNSAAACLFIGNTAGCYNVDAGGELNMAGNICR